MSKLKPNTQVVANNTDTFLCTKTDIEKLNLQGEFVDEHLFILDPKWIESKKIVYKLSKSCLVCGSKKKPTNHHVTPRRIMKKYPQYLRGKLFTHNLVRLCVECHMAFNHKFDLNDSSLDIQHWDEKLHNFIEKWQDTLAKQNANQTKALPQTKNPPQEKTTSPNIIHSPKTNKKNHRKHKHNTNCKFCRYLIAANIIQTIFLSIIVLIIILKQ